MKEYKVRYPLIVYILFLAVTVVCCIAFIQTFNAKNVLMSLTIFFLVGVMVYVIICHKYIITGSQMLVYYGIIVRRIDLSKVLNIERDGVKIVLTIGTEEDNFKGTIRPKESQVSSMYKDISDAISFSKEIDAYNTFVNLCALTEIEKVEQSFKPYYYLFWYITEVGSGGHLQFFENMKVKNYDEMSVCLQAFNNDKLTDVFNSALEIYKKSTYHISSLDEYIEVEDREIYKLCDKELLKLRSFIQEKFKDYANEHFIK